MIVPIFETLRASSRKPGSPIPRFIIGIQPKESGDSTNGLRTDETPRPGERSTWRELDAEGVRSSVEAASATRKHQTH